MFVKFKVEVNSTNHLKLIIKYKVRVGIISRSDLSHVVDLLISFLKGMGCVQNQRNKSTDKVDCCKRQSNSCGSTIGSCVRL